MRNYREFFFENFSLGFTLIELLVSTAIIALLAGLTIPFFQDFSKRQSLHRGAEQVKSDLRTVQNRATSGIDRKDGATEYYWWGIDFVYGGDNRKYALIQSDNEADPAVGSTREVRVRNLSSELDITTDKTIWFRMITGEIVGAGDVVVRRVGGTCAAGDCRTVTVTAGGRIE